MKKIIFALICILVFTCPLLQVFANDSQNSVSAVDGNVTVSCVTEAAKGVPVTVFILPKIMEGDIDVTAEKVKLAQTKGELDALSVEYIASFKAGDDGLVSFNCKMKEELSTGEYNVVFNYLGLSSPYVAGSFEHVGKADINALVTAFNSSAASGYSAIIDGDANGVGIEAAKKILEKSSADVSYYFSLENTSDFCDILFSLKPEEGFGDLLSLVSAFNEAAAWNKLWQEEDTLSVISAYNGSESGDYWNLDIAENSDFDGLTETEKSEILKEIKDGKYKKNEDLEADFEELLVLALFRETDTREKLEELISEDGKYGAYFEDVRKLIEDEDLSKYETTKLYNSILDENVSCKTFEEIKELFLDSVPEEEKSSGGGGGSSVGASGGYKSNAASGIKLNSASVDTNPVNKTSESDITFSDVTSSYWASEYIERLSKKGAINGVGEEKFAPNGLILRQDFVKILIGALGIDMLKSESAFSDVESGAYYEKYVATAFAKGLISGVEADKFGIGMNIKREDAAVIMARVLESYGVETSDKNIAFTDSEDMASYAKDAINKVADAGIFGGDDKGAFNPKANLTRAETCAILCRLADIIEGV